MVVKIPRFAFEKFPGADPELTTTMKSVGEAMALGRNFAEALNKAMRSMETTAAGFWTLPDPAVPAPAARAETLAALRTPHDGRLYTVERALRLGCVVGAPPGASGICGGEDDLVVADRHPAPGILKAHPGEQRLGRHIGRLCPASAAVVREHDDAVLAHRDQPRAGRRDRDQERLRGQARGLGVPRRGLGGARPADHSERRRESEKGFSGGRAGVASRA